eukprot:1823797-Amphidinium_carterae.1
MLGRACMEKLTRMFLRRSGKHAGLRRRFASHFRTPHLGRVLTSEPPGTEKMGGTVGKCATVCAVSAQG